MYRHRSCSFSSSNATGADRHRGWRTCWWRHSGRRNDGCRSDVLWRYVYTMFVDTQYDRHHTDVSHLAVCLFQRKYDVILILQYWSWLIQWTTCIIILSRYTPPSSHVYHLVTYWRCRSPSVAVFSGCGWVRASGHLQTGSTVARQSQGSWYVRTVRYSYSVYTLFQDCNHSFRNNRKLFKPI